MRQRIDTMTLWLAWVIAGSAAFTMVPAGPLGLLGWFGALGSLLPRLIPLLPRLSVLIGFGLLTLCAVAMGFPVAWYEILLPALVLAVGLWLAPTPGGGAARETFAPAAPGMEEFHRALRRELTRARRFERSLTVFSVSTAAAQGSHQLRAAVASQLQIYSLVIVADHRVLAMVPELGTADCETVAARIVDAASPAAASVEIGHASFPADALTAAALIRAADDRRRRPVPAGTATASGTASKSDSRLGTELPSP